MLSVTKSREFSLQYNSISSREVIMSGLIILPRIGGIPQSPLQPVPRTMFKSTVSALSLRLCAVAIFAFSPAVFLKHSYLFRLPHSSSLSPVFYTQAVCQSGTRSILFPGFCKIGTKFSSRRASSPRIPWFT